MKIVSIRTRSFDRVMHTVAATLGDWQQVSIRTRSFDRVMPAVASRHTMAISCFNPHPVFRPGDAPAPA